MVDMENKIIKFGYGDIQVHSSWYYISFRQFKPPIEIGTEITDEIIQENNFEYITEPISINFKNLEELYDFRKLVKEIDENHTCFKYRDCTFDFSNYNSKSVEVLLKGIKVVENGFIMPMAC